MKLPRHGNVVYGNPYKFTGNAIESQFYMIFFWFNNSLEYIAETEYAQKSNRN